MGEEDKGTVEDTPLGGFIIGVLLAAASIYVVSQPGVFADKPYAPWLVGFGGLVGLWMMLSNGLKLYGRRFRKLESVEADAWADDALAGVCVGTIKWSFIAAVLFGAYRFLTGPLEELDFRTKLIATMLAVIIVMLFLVLQSLDKVLNRMK